MRLRNLLTELVCQLEGFAVAVAVMVIWGILGFVIEWYWNMVIGAMYAGAFLGPAVFHFILLRGGAMYVFALALDFAFGVVSAICTAYSVGICISRRPHLVRDHVKTSTK